MINAVKASIGYWVARRLMRFPRLVKNPKLWHWMEGQFARKAQLGSTSAQSFYGHILLYRGQGFGAKQEGVRLLKLAAHSGDAKSAYQLGVLAFKGDMTHAPEPLEAVKWWELAAESGHALAAKRLSDLYTSGAVGVAIDLPKAAHYSSQASKYGL